MAYRDNRLHEGKPPGLDQYLIPDRRPSSDVRKQLQDLIREIQVGPPPNLVEIGEKLYVNPEEAVGTLGLDVNQKQIAARLIELVADNSRDMFGIAKEAYEAGIPDPAVRAILRRGRQMSFRNQISKAKAADIGEIHEWQSGKWRKTAQGWQPVDKKAQQAAARGESPGKAKSKPKAQGDQKKQGDPDVHARFAGLQAKAKQHKINITGEVGGHHTHEHMDKLEEKLNARIKENSDRSAAEEKATKRERPAPEDAPGKQEMQQELGDLVDRLKGIEHRIDDDHKPMFDRLLGEAKSIGKNPTGQAIDWYSERVDSFVHLSTGKRADGGDDGSPPAGVKEHAEAGDEAETDHDDFRTGAQKAAGYLKKLPKEAVHRIVHSVQHTAGEFKTASAAVGKLLDGEPLAKEDYHAIVSVGVTIGTVALAGLTYGAEKGAIYGATKAGKKFSEKMLYHVALGAVNHHLATAYVAHGGLKLGQKAAYMLDLLSKAEDAEKIEVKSRKKPAKKEKKNTDQADEASTSDAPSPEMVKFAQGVVASMIKLLDRNWSDDEIDQVIAEEDDEGNMPEIEKSAVYLDLGTGRLVTGAEVVEGTTRLLKAKYKRRWRGSDGKWRYEYAPKPKNKHEGDKLPDGDQLRMTTTGVANRLIDAWASDKRAVGANADPVPDKLAKLATWAAEQDRKHMWERWAGSVLKRPNQVKETDPDPDQSEARRAAAVEIRRKVLAGLTEKIKGKSLDPTAKKTRKGLIFDLEKSERVKPPRQRIDRCKPPRRRAVDVLQVFTRLEPLAKSLDILVQFDGDSISVLGDLQKSGVPAYMLDHPGAQSATLDARQARDLLNLMESWS